MRVDVNLSEADAFVCGLKRKLVRLSTGANQEREDKDHEQFSPTHFSVDLFAPHSTTKQVVGEFVDDSESPLESLKSSTNTSEDLEEVSPSEQAEQMLAMLDRLKEFNHPGNEALTQQEWEELEMTWSVPIAGSRMDLIPGGDVVRVLLADKDKYCEKASEALLVCIKQANSFA